MKGEGGGCYRDLIVWQKAMELAKLVYKRTKDFPKEEVYGLVSQIRRCSVSIPSNIAEGKGRGSNKDFVKFLHIARGSLYELQTQWELAMDFGYAQKSKDISDLSLEVEKMLNSLIRSKKDA